MNSKIYSNIYVVSICFIFFLLTYFLRNDLGGFQNIYFVFPGFGILFCLFTYFVPFYRYGKEGICVKFGNRYFINYRWEDVNSIHSFPTFASHITWISMKDKGGVILSPLFTRNYFDVLGDIVKFARTRNTRATIDELTLEKLKKREVWTKFKLPKNKKTRKR